MSLSSCTSITTAPTTADATHTVCNGRSIVTTSWVRAQPTYNGMHRGQHSLTACSGYSIVVDEDVLQPPAPVTRYVYLEPLS